MTLLESVLMWALLMDAALFTVFLTSLRHGFRVQSSYRGFAAFLTGAWGIALTLVFTHASWNTIVGEIQSRGLAANTTGIALLLLVILFGVGASLGYLANFLGYKHGQRLGSQKICELNYGEQATVVEILPNYLVLNRVRKLLAEGKLTDYQIWDLLDLIPREKLLGACIDMDLQDKYALSKDQLRGFATAFGLDHLAAMLEYENAEEIEDVNEGIGLLTQKEEALSTNNRKTLALIFSGVRSVRTRADFIQLAANLIESYSLKGRLRAEGRKRRHLELQGLVITLLRRTIASPKTNKR